MITSWSQLLEHLGKMVSFDGENPGDASVGTLETVISLAESRIYREIRTGYNEATLSDTTLDNTITLPSDFRAMSFVHFGKQPLEPVSPEFLREYNFGHSTDVDFVDAFDPGQMSLSSGVCKYFAKIGQTIQFGTPVADGSTIYGYYYKALPALSAATLPSNTLFAAANDLFLYAAMVEAAPLYGFQDQIGIWEAKYQGVRDALNKEHMQGAYSSGRIKRRASTQLMG